LFVGLLRKSEVLFLEGVRHLLGSGLVVAVEVLVKVLSTVEEEVTVDEGEMVLVAMVARGVVSMVSIPVFRSPSRVA
jgi:hypothetical protein